MASLGGNVRHFISSYYRFGLIMPCLVLALILSPGALAASPWFGSSPSLALSGSSLSQAEYDKLRTARQGLSAGIECINKKIARRAFGSLSIQYQDDCWYSTKIGLLNRRGDYLLQPGAQVAGHIGGSSPTQPVLVATKNDQIFLELTPDLASGGYKLGFRNLTDAVFTRTEHATGTVTLELVGPATNIVTFSDNSRFTIKQQHIYWSDDGRFMLVWGEGGILYRINLESFQVLTLRVTSYPGFPMWGSAALSPSATTAALAIERIGAVADLFIIDLASCNAGETALVPLAVNGTTCTQRSVKSLLQSGVNGFSAPLLPRFYSEHTIGFYHPEAGTAGVYKQYILQAAGTTYEPSGYIALGDSFSSGEGAGDYLEGTDVKGVNMCHTSRNSYPYLVNQRLNLSSFLSLACSSAKMENFWSVVQDENAETALNKQFPGRSAQKTYLTESEIVTITMSGNDLGFTEKLRYCLVWSANCYNNYEERKEIANQIKTLHPELVKMYRHAIGDLPKPRRLYVLGYPQLMSPDANADCAENVNFNPYQRKMANDLITYFNAVIKSAARHAGAYYVGTEGALSGHKMCEGPTDTMAVHGLTFGDETLLKNIGPISNSSYHPNQLGHQLLATAVITKTSGLTAAPESADTSLAIPSPDDYEFLNIASGGGIIHNIIYNPITDNAAVKRGVNLVLKYKQVLNPFLAGSPISILLRSDPVVLGHLHANQLGFVDGSVSLPAGITPGMHELRLDGTGEDGKPTSVRQFIFVYAELDDFNGNGIPDSDEPCRGLPASGKDSDGDGLDDACDPLIGKAVIEESPQSQPQGEVISPVDPVAALSVTNTPNPQVLGVSDYQTFTLRSIQNQAAPESGRVESPPQDSQIVPPPGSASLVPPAGDSGKNWYLAGAITIMLLLGYSIYNYASKKVKKH